MKNNLSDNALITLWAIAECGIGGILHALKLPFTGIFVGGIAIMCIYLLASTADNVKSKILEATSIVIMVKFLVSPHSPWQAYVAVVFQAYMGILFFSNKSFSKIKVILFSVICFLESALQKILISLLIYGLQFFEAINSAVKHLAKNLSLDISFSAMQWVFGSYIVLHLISGLALGIWLPKINSDLSNYSNQLMLSFEASSAEETKKKNRINPFIYGIIIFTLFLLTLHFLLPPNHKFNLLLVLIRTLSVSLVMILIIGPLIKKFIISKFFSQKYETRVNEIADNLPLFFSSFKTIVERSKGNTLGLSRWKYILLSFLVNSHSRQT